MRKVLDVTVSTLATALFLFYTAFFFVHLPAVRAQDKQQGAKETPQSNQVEDQKIKEEAADGVDAADAERLRAIHAALTEMQAQIAKDRAIAVEAQSLVNEFNALLNKATAAAQEQEKIFYRFLASKGLKPENYKLSGGVIVKVAPPSSPPK